MEKKVLVTSILLCLLSIPLLREFRISVRANQNVIYVPDNYKKIQWAINNATEGDVIFVRNGTYYENIVINKRITLIGENRDSTIIDGSDIGSVIFISRSENVNITGFTITRSGSLFYNSSGILIEYSQNNVISNNIILNNYKGISLFSSSGNIIRANKILNNLYTGISLYSSNNNLIEDNNISSNAEGISFYWSTLNKISANTIVNNPSGGMVLAFLSNNNVIYRNNFNNTLQVWSYESTNFWSYNNEGNYWSDYNGTDFYCGPNQDRLGSDGIGDIPYVIDETNIDKSPLMGMFSKFDITYKEETHQVTIISNSTIFDFQFRVGFETGNKIINFKPIGNASVAGFCRVKIPMKIMNYPNIFLLGDEDFSPSFLDVSNEAHNYLYFTYLHKNQTVTIISSDWYNNLLNIYYYLLDNYTQLQRSFEQLNASYQDYLHSYSESVSNIKNLTYILAAGTAILIIVITYLSKQAHSTNRAYKLKSLKRSNR